MDRFPALKILLGSMTLLLLVVPVSEGDTLKVGQNGILSIQQAVDTALGNASTSDTILVPAGIYNESVQISFASLTGANAQEKLTIRRTGGGQVRVTSPGASSAIHLEDVTNVHLEDLTLESGSTSDGIGALVVAGQSINVTCEDLDGVAGDDFGVQVTSSTALGVGFEDCDFSGMLEVGFTIDGLSHELDDCEASACGSNGIVLAATSSNCSVRYTKAHALGGTSVTDPGVITVRGSGHHFYKTTASGGGSDGFFVEGTGHKLRKCDSDDNSGAGYHLNGTQAALLNCDAVGNIFGVQGGGQGALVQDGFYGFNASHGLLILDNGTLVDDIFCLVNGGHGVLVSAGVTGTKVFDCYFKSNLGEGLVVAGDLTWVQKNYAKSGDGLVDQGSNNGGRDNKVKSGGQNDF